MLQGDLPGLNYRSLVFSISIEGQCWRQQLCMKQLLNASVKVPIRHAKNRLSIYYTLPSNQNLSSEIKPPAGAFKSSVMEVAIVFLGALVVIANENDKVATATKTIKINIFDFIRLIFSLLIDFF